MDNTNETKTRLAWLLEYPEPYRTQAILNTEKHVDVYYEEYPLSDIVEESMALRGFRWDGSPEGKAYWENFYANRHMKPTKFYRYPWHEAPEWAVFANTDNEGVGYWVGVVACNEFHIPNIFEIEGHQFDTTDWKNSVEIRPVEFQKPKQ